jgi:hypothetical protein
VRATTVGARSRHIATFAALQLLICYQRVGLLAEAAILLIGDHLATGGKHDYDLQMGKFAWTEAPCSGGIGCWLEKRYTSTGETAGQWIASCYTVQRNLSGRRSNLLSRSVLAHHRVVGSYLGAF